MNMTKKEGYIWAGAAIVLVLALVGFERYGAHEEKEAMEDMQAAMTASTTMATTTDAAVLGTPEGMSARPTAPSSGPVVQSNPNVGITNMTIVGSPARTLVVQMDKKQVDVLSGVGIEFKELDGRTSYFTVTMNDCPGDGTCSTRDNSDKENFQASAPFQFSYGNYIIELTAANKDEATFSIKPKPGFKG